MNFMFFIYNLNYNYLVPNLFFNQPEPTRPTLQLIIFSYLLDLINYPSLRYQLGSRSTWSTSHIIHSTSIDYKNIYIILGALGVNIVLRVVEVLRQHQLNFKYLLFANYRSVRSVFCFIKSGSFKSIVS